MILRRIRREGKAMSSDFVETLVNLATILLVLAVGVRLGYVLVSRSAAREADVIERHFANNLEMWERHHILQLESDAAARARENMKESYDLLAVWLHETERRIDEIRFGAISHEDHLVLKAQVLLGDRPWEIIKPPPELASAQFYWSANVRESIRSLEGPFSRFAGLMRSITIALNEEDREAARDEQTEIWRAASQLSEIIERIGSHARDDLTGSTAARARA